MAKMFLEQNNKEFSKNITGFSDEAEKLLLNYEWPGNVRELKNVMERAVILCQNEIVDAEHLPIPPRPTGSVRYRKQVPQATLSGCGVGSPLPRL